MYHRYSFGLGFVSRVVALCGHVRARWQMMLRRRAASTTSRAATPATGRSGVSDGVGSAVGALRVASAQVADQFTARVQGMVVQMAVELWLLPRIADADRPCVYRVLQSVFTDTKLPVASAWVHHAAQPPTGAPKPLTSSFSRDAHGLMVPTELPHIVAKSGAVRGVQLSDRQIAVALQLFSTQQVTSQVVVTGGAGCGKSTIIRCLASACRNLRGVRSMTGGGVIPVHSVVETPVCIGASSVRSMFGGFHVRLGRRVWQAGLLASLLRRAAINYAAQRAYTWVVLDGPVDPVVCDVLAALHPRRTLRGGIVEPTTRWVLCRADTQ